MTKKEKKELEEKEQKKAEESSKEDEQKSEEEGSEQEEELTEEEKAQALAEREEEARKKEQLLNAGEEEKSTPHKKKKVEEEEEDDEDEEEDDEEDNFWEEKEKKKVKEEKPGVSREEIDRIVEERLKPFKEQEQARMEEKKKLARRTFFEKHPEYISDANKWSELLDELDSFSREKIASDYGTYLEKAHRIVDGTVSQHESRVENHKKTIAESASGGDGGSGSRDIQDGESDDTALTASEKKIAKAWGVSLETMKELKKKEKDGSSLLFYPTTQ